MVGVDRVSTRGSPEGRPQGFTGGGVRASGLTLAPLLPAGSTPQASSPLLELVPVALSRAQARALWGGSGRMFGATLPFGARWRASRSMSRC